MKHLVIGLGSVTGVATLVTLGLVLLDRPVAAAIIGTATAFLWLALLVVGTVAVTSWWSASLMERGARIALIAETSDDRRDVAMINAISKMSAWWKESQPDRLALPLPSQQGDWLPELAEFNVEVGHD